MAITNEELYKELHQIKEAQERHKETVDRWRATIEARQQKNDKTLYGNGEPGMDEVLRSHGQQLGKHERMLDAVHAMIQPMVVFFKAGVWVVSIVGVSIIALIWSLITGQAQLIFP